MEAHLCLFKTHHFDFFIFLQKTVLIKTNVNGVGLLLGNESMMVNPPVWHM